MIKGFRFLTVTGQAVVVFLLVSFIGDAVSAQTCQPWNCNPDGSTWRYGKVAIDQQHADTKLNIHIGGQLGIGEGIRLNRSNPNGLHFLGIFGNMANGSYSPMTKAGDFMVLLRGPAPDDPQAGFVIAPWGYQASGLRVAENGHVGIGTPDPGDAMLAVNGNIKLSGSIVSEGDICIGSGCP